MWFLHEQVSPIRWAGVVCIMIGAGLITYSEHAKPKLSSASPPAAQLEAPNETPVR
jgi:drug/metabolite transporter (DMT)-like permease